MRVFSRVNPPAAAASGNRAGTAIASLLPTIEECRTGSAFFAPYSLPPARTSDLVLAWFQNLHPGSVSTAKQPGSTVASGRQNLRRPNRARSTRQPIRKLTSAQAEASVCADSHLLGRIWAARAAGKKIPMLGMLGML